MFLLSDFIGKYDPSPYLSYAWLRFRSMRKALSTSEKWIRFADQNFNSITSIRLHYLPLASLIWFRDLINKTCSRDRLCNMDLCKRCIRFQMFHSIPYFLSNNDKETVFSIIFIFQHDRCFNSIIDMFQHNANQLLEKLCYFDHTISWNFKMMSCFIVTQAFYSTSVRACSHITH